MPYAPADLLVLKAEIQINGVWTTITGRARSAGNVAIRQGMSDGANGPETSRLRCVLGNDDAWLTEDNPNSPWWPHIGRGTPLRLSLTGVLPADAGRFAGQIDRLEAVYPGGGGSMMQVEAIGTWGTLAQNDEEPRSALYRTIEGASSGTVVPAEYWTLEDAADATQFGSAVGGLAAAAWITTNGSQAPVPAGHSGIPGSSTSVQMRDGSTIRMPVRPYTDTGLLAVQIAFIMDTIVSRAWMQVLLDNGTVIEVRVTDDLDPGLIQSLMIIVMDVDQNIVAFDSAQLDANLIAEPFSVMVAVADTVPGDDFTARVLDGSGDIRAELTTTNVGYSTVARIDALGTLSPTDFSGVSHAALFTDPAFDPDVDTIPIARAVSAWDGETVEDRIVRLGLEAHLNVTLTGTSSQRMGPQLPAKLTSLFADCQDLDQGLWSDSRTGIGMVYRTGSNLYTQLAQVAVIRGSLTPDTAPVWDYQQICNEWTVSRPGGSSSTQADEDHVAKVRRRLKGSIAVNAYSDDQLDDQAGQRVNVTTAPGPRYPSLGVNLRNTDGADLADAVLGMEAGDRMTVAAAALPVQHPPGGADQLVIGWEEELDADMWEFRPVTRPYRPYKLVGRWALVSKVLHAAISSSVTSIAMANTDAAQPMLATSPADIGVGYSITIGAEQLQLTAVAASTIGFGATGAVSSGASGSRTPGLPTGSASGDLVVVFASTRNSGTGTVDTPAGWTRLAVFPTGANCGVFARIYDGLWSMPTITFTGGAANEDTIAQSCRLTGKWHDPSKILTAAASCLNPSAQNIIFPGLPAPACDNSIILYFGWKQDDWTSAATVSGATEIAENTDSAGNDAAQVWDYLIQTSAVPVAADAFSITGGTGAPSRGAVAVLRCDYQSATVSRGANGTTAASHAAGDAVTLTDPARWALL